MTAQDMLDYTFGLLDDPEREAFEREMSTDPALSARVARLGSSVAILVDDGESIEPPPGLAARTVELVENRKRRPHFQDFVPSRVPFRWADVAVAATVFFAAILTLTVPLMKSRAQMDQTACAFNLGQLGVSLARYTSTHGSYPVVPASYPVGMYGMMLHDTHDLTDPAVLSCPCAARAKARPKMPSCDDFQKMFSEAPEHCREMLDGHFAYNVGYRRRNGEAVAIPGSPGAFIPIAADGPGWTKDGEILEGNSPNHGGHGQNVLFSDGHVSWRRTRWISEMDTDLFLNENLLPAPGVHPADSALVPSVMPVRSR